MLTPTEKREMLQEIARAADILSPIREDEFSLTEIAEAAGCAYSTAVRGMNALLAEGKVTRRRALLHGRAGWAYRYVKDDDDGC
jgi:predicted transcriptional regulator